MLAISGFYLGQDVRVQNPAACLSTLCLLSALVGLAGYVLIFLGGTKGFLEYLTREGYIQSKGPVPPPQIGSGVEENEILGMTNELLGQRILPRTKSVAGVGWAEDLPWDAYQFKRHGRRKPPMFLISASLRGKVAVEDWKILLTYFFLRDKPRHRLMLGTLLSLMLPFFLLGLGGIVVSSIYGIQGGTLYGQFIAGPIALLLLIRIFVSSRKMFLKLDRLTARSIGATVCWTVFRKWTGWDCRM